MKKLLIASDIHGSAFWCRKLAERIATESPDKIILLGDLLYHGPRNDLPQDYAPKEVLAILNGYKDKIIAVRGNCDAEVDQMVLEFPMLADYTTLLLPDGTTVFATHGHLYDDAHPLLLCPDDVLLCGHTHLYADEIRNGHRYLNPGSVSLPKEGRTNSYMTWEPGKFILKDMDGNVVSL